MSSVSRPWLARLRALDVLALTALLWFLAKFLRYAFPPLFGTLQTVYGVSNTELGLTFSALMGGYAVMQFPSGALADRIGTVRVIVGGAVVAAAAAIALFASTTYPVLLVAVVGIGVGTGAHKTVAITLLTTVYPDRSGRALGTMDFVGELGGALAPVVVVAVLAAALPWASLFLAAAVGGLCLAAAFAVRVPVRLPNDAADAGFDADDGLRSYLAVFAAPRFSAFALVAVLVSLTVSGVTAFLPLFLESRPGIDTSLAGLLYSGFFLVSVVQPVTGDLADRLGALRVIVVLLALAITALAVLVVAGVGPLVVGVATLALGVGLHGVRPGRDAHLMNLIPDDVAGGTLGVVRTSMLGLSAVSPAVVGYLSDVASFSVAFGALAAALALATAVVAALALTD
ncbi:MFS transporter [Haloplanus salinus]|uniref:MFS transporter n=1 Tax=Haloplanus salinus TaxID=1126245 RepID=A0A368NAW7_9EURY|nr:MFS transporter [Haloplanus salinus]RCU47366.1 MFS transporter [Haloplanus salinus]